MKWHDLIVCLILVHILSVSYTNLNVQQAVNLLYQGAEDEICIARFSK